MNRVPAQPPRAIHIAQLVVHEDQFIWRQCQRLTHGLVGTRVGLRQERQVLEYFSKNPEMKDQLRAPIFEEKTVDFILELAKVSEKSVTPEELLKAAREADEEEAGEKAAD